MPFQPGQSGNPSGRPKENPEVKALARELSLEAIRGLAAIARDKKAPHSARVAAWNSVLDRGLGKPSQDVTVRHDLNPDTLSDAELAAIAVGGGPTPAASEDDPAGPGGVVH